MAYIIKHPIRLKTRLLYFLFFLIFGFGINTSEAAIVTYTWTGSSPLGTNQWNDALNWSSTTGLYPGASATTDEVVIGKNAAIVYSFTSANAIHSITINNGFVVSITFTTVNPTVTFANNAAAPTPAPFITVNSNATLNLAGTGSIAGTSNITVSNGATFTGVSTVPITAASITAQTCTITLGGLLTLSGQLQTTSAICNLTTSAAGNTIAGGLNVHSQSTLNWYGGTSASTTLSTNSSQVYVNSTAPATLTIESNNTLTFTATLAVDALSGTGNALLVNNGNLNITNCSLITQSSGLTTSATAITNNGTITLTGSTAGITLAADNILANNGLITTATSYPTTPITTNNPSTINNNSGGVMTLTNGTVTMVNGSTLNNNSGSILNLAGTSLIFSGGSSGTNGGTINAGSSSTISLSSNPVTLTNNSGGVINLSGSSLSLAPGTTINNSGTVAAILTSSISLNGNPAVFNDLVSSSLTMSASAFNMTVGSSLTNTGGTVGLTNCSFNCGVGNPTTITNQNSSSPAVTGVFTGSNTSFNFTGTTNFTNSGTITINNGSSITTSGSSETTTSITNSGTFNAGSSAGSNCTILFNGSADKLSNTGTFNLSSTSIITIAGGSTAVSNSGSGVFTLLSDSYGSATCINTSSSSSPPNFGFDGNFSVQRYITGGLATYRAYRLLSSQVNINSIYDQTSAEGYLGLSYLNSGMLTGGPGTGFDVTTTNPLMYFYNETRAHNTTAYIGGKNVGVYAITNSTGSPAYSITTYGTTLASKTAGVQVPVGNSCEVYFVGNTSNTTTSTIPNSATVTALGYLNQGTIPVYVFNGATASKTMTYTTGTGVPVAGLQQVGNPYASTIDLDSLYYDNNTLSPVFYELKTPSSAFVSYNAASHTTSGSSAGAYIVSGEGFVVGALASPAVSTLTFYEKEKVNVQLTSSTTPPLILSQRQKAVITAAQLQPPGLTGLHLQLSQDSVTNIQTGIYFSNSWSDKYIPAEDAKDISTAIISLSSYSLDTQRLCINQMSSYTKGKTIKLYVAATTNGTYNISLADINNIDQVYSVYLRDHKLNDSVDLRTTNSYSFAINNSDTTSYGNSRFDVVIGLKQLPLYQLLSFAGQKISKGVQLNWQALNPGDYTGFTLQKEASNGSFSALYTTQSNNTTNYSYTDPNPVTGNNTYRLAQSDFYGNITYSQAVTIGYNNVSSNGLIQIYPNPGTILINVQINPTSSTPQNYTADIYSSSGTKMEHRSLNTYSWTDDISSYMQGVYILVLKDNNGNILGKTKFIKGK